MSYEDESLSIPPETAAARHRRRGGDHVNWRRVVRAVVLSTPVWGPAAWWIVSTGLETYGQWLEFAKLPGQIRALEDADLAKRLASLERYRCILGYDPGGALGKASILPRDRRSECRTEQKAPEQ
jgi:hypothetical protein